MTKPEDKDAVGVSSELHTTEASESAKRAQAEAGEPDPTDAQQRFKRLIGQANEIKKQAEAEKE